MRARLTLLLLVAALCLAAATEADPKPSTKSPKKTGHPSNVPLKAPPKPVAATGPAALPSQAPQELADIASDSLKEFVGDDFNDIKFHPKADQAKLQAIQDALTSSYAASKPKTAEQAKQEAEWKAEAEIAEKAANKFLDNEAIDARAAAADKETDTDSEDVPAAPGADSKAPAKKKADKLKSIEDRIASAKTAVESARETEQLLTAEANKLKASAKEEEELIIARDAAEDARAAYYATQRAVKHLKRLQTVLSLQKKSEKASKLARKLRHVAVKLTGSAKDRFDNVEALFAVRAARHATVAAKKLSVSLKVYSAKVDAREQSNAVDQIKKVLQDATSAKEKLDIGGELETAQAKLAKLNRIANSKRLAHRLQLYRAKAKLLRVEDRARRLSIRARKFTAKAVTKEEKETAKVLSDAAAHNKKRAAKLRRKVRGLRSAYELDSFVRRVRRLTRRQQRLVLGIKLASSKQRKRLALQLAKTQADLDKARAYLSVLKREVAVHTAHELVRKLKAKAKKLRAQAAALKKAIKKRDDKKAAKKAEAEATKAEAKATQAKAELKELLQSLNLVKASSAYAKPQGLEKLQVQIEKKLKKHQPKAPSSGSASNATSAAL